MHFFFFFADVTLNVSTPGKLKKCLTVVGVEPATIIIINVYPTERPMHNTIKYKNYLFIFIYYVSPPQMSDSLISKNLSL